MNKRASRNSRYSPTHYEHCANTVSHAIWILPSIIASEVLLNAGRMKSQETVNCTENVVMEFTSRSYGITLVLLFLISSVYHWMDWNQHCLHEGNNVNVTRPSLTRTFHLCDRTSIYLFIAGSYQPWLLLASIDESLRWLQWEVWLAAIVGTVYTFLYLDKNKLLETVFYVFHGLGPGLVLFGTGPWLEHSTHQQPGITPLVLGGVTYLTGVVIYKCDGKIPFAHAIWHTFVAAGALFHFYAAYSVFYV